MIRPRPPSEEEFRIPVLKAIGGKHPLRRDQLKMRVILRPSLVKHGPRAINVSLRMLKAIASLVARVKARNASDIIESATETRESKYPLLQREGQSPAPDRRACELSRRPTRIGCRRIGHCGVVESPILDISRQNRMTTAISHLTDFCSGRLKQRTLLAIFIPLILASYFRSLTLAIWMFPGPFDWRTRSMLVCTPT